MGHIVAFGDTELQALELGCSVHIVHKMDRNFETFLPTPTPQNRSKVRIVVLRKDCNSSAI